MAIRLAPPGLPASPSRTVASARETLQRGPRERRHLEDLSASDPDASTLASWSRRSPSTCPAAPTLPWHEAMVPFWSSTCSRGSSEAKQPEVPESGLRRSAWGDYSNLQRHSGHWLSHQMKVGVYRFLQAMSDHKDLTGQRCAAPLPASYGGPTQARVAWVGPPSPCKATRFRPARNAPGGCQAPRQRVANSLEFARWRRMRRNSHVRCEDEDGG